MHYTDINASYIRNNEELENHEFLRIFRTHFFKFVKNRNFCRILFLKIRILNLRPTPGVNIVHLSVLGEGNQRQNVVSSSLHLQTKSVVVQTNLPDTGFSD